MVHLDYDILTYKLVLFVQRFIFMRRAVKTSPPRSNDTAQQQKCYLVQALRMTAQK